jgi:hypothetical protein
MRTRFTGEVVFARVLSAFSKWSGERLVAPEQVAENPDGIGDGQASIVI